MDCKKALQEADGDMEKAQELLREKGLAAAAKKAGRIAAEGVVESYIAEDGKTGALVEVNCETDFVANTPEFKEFVKDIARHVAEKEPAFVSEEEAGPGASKETILLEQPFAGNSEMTVQELVSEKVGKIGEKISVRRFTRFGPEDDGKTQVIDSYIHGGGKIGVMVEVECDSDAAASTPEFKQFVRDLAMHIAATNPMYLGEEDIDPAVIEKEREILTVQAQNEGKPENIIGKMVDGRIKKFKKEICLVDQPFVKDPDITIQEFVNNQSKKSGEDVSIRRFVRYEMGEGLEKRKDDFAQEVAAQAGK